MSDITFSIKDLQRVRESKQFVTKERFLHYAEIRHDLSEIESKDMWEEYYKFPFKTNNFSAEVLVVALDIFDFLWECWENQIPLEYYEQKHIKKVFYRNAKGENKELVIDLLKTEDVLSYAKIIEGCAKNEKQEIINIASSVDGEYRDGKDFYIFEGDIYFSYDNFWGNKKGNVYVAHDGKIKRLLYVKGKGYLKNNEPNIDDEDSSFSTYAVFRSEYIYMGNAKIDINFLNDK